MLSMEAPSQTARSWRAAEQQGLSFSCAVAVPRTPDTLPGPASVHGIFAYATYSSASASRIYDGAKQAAACRCSPRQAKVVRPWDATRRSWAITTTDKTEPHGSRCKCRSFSLPICVCSIEVKSLGRGLARAQITDLISFLLSCVHSHRHAMQLFRACAAFAHRPPANNARHVAEARLRSLALVDAYMAMLPRSVEACSIARPRCKSVRVAAWWLQLSTANSARRRRLSGFRRAAFAMPTVLWI